MRNFQGLDFVWTQTYREIFKSASVYLSVLLWQVSSSAIQRWWEKERGTERDRESFITLKCWLNDSLHIINISKILKNLIYYFWIPKYHFISLNQLLNIWYFKKTSLTERCSVRQVFRNVWLNSRENNCTGALFDR